MAAYRAVQLKDKGGLDQLQEVELPLEDPKNGEIRIRVRASGVGFTDILKRTGYYPFVQRSRLWRVMRSSAMSTPWVKGFRVSRWANASAH